MAYDSVHGRIWTITAFHAWLGFAYHHVIHRTGEQLEFNTSYSPPVLVANHGFASSATFNDDTREVMISFATDELSVPCSGLFGSPSGSHPVYAQIASPPPQFEARNDIIEQPTHIPGSVSVNTTPWIGNPNWVLSAQDPTGCVPIGASAFFLFGASGVFPGPTLAGFGCGFGPGELNISPRIAVPGPHPWNGASPIRLPAIAIPPERVLIGYRIYVQTVFLSQTAGVDTGAVLVGQMGI